MKSESHTGQKVKKEKTLDLDMEIQKPDTKHNMRKTFASTESQKATYATQQMT